MENNVSQSNLHPQFNISKEGTTDQNDDLRSFKLINDKHKKSVDQLFQIIYSNEPLQLKVVKRAIPKPRQSKVGTRQRIRKSFDISSGYSCEGFGFTIPEFYSKQPVEFESELQKLYPPDRKINLKMLSSILVEQLNLPSFFALPMMVSLNPLIFKTRVFEIPYSTFLNFAVPKLERATLPEKIFRIFLGNHQRDYLIQNDIVPYIASLIQTHPSLTFLEQEVSLQSSFIKCIVSRIFFELDPEMRGRIYFYRIVNSNFCDCLVAVDKAVDVSDISDFFSYEHFYVLMSKFWEIDSEERGTITMEQISKYDDNRIPIGLCRRLFKQLNPRHNSNALTFIDFVLFMLAVEDKSSETSFRLWFNVCDLDDDGLLSMSEIKQLYKIQKEKMKAGLLEPIKFKYIYSQIIDLFGNWFAKESYITISSLRNTGNWETFFNVLIDLKKFSEWDSQDPKREQVKKRKYRDMKTWDIFCEIEYARLT